MNRRLIIFIKTSSLLFYLIAFLTILPKLETLFQVLFVVPNRGMFVFLIALAVILLPFMILLCIAIMLNPLLVSRLERKAGGEISIHPRRVKLFKIILGIMLILASPIVAAAGFLIFAMSAAAESLILTLLIGGFVVLVTLALLIGGIIVLVSSSKLKQST